jgi:hypothetical protein
VIYRCLYIYACDFGGQDGMWFEIGTVVVVVLKGQCETHKFEEFV